MASPTPGSTRSFNQPQQQSYNNPSSTSQSYRQPGARDYGQPSGPTAGMSQAQRDALRNAKETATREQQQQQANSPSKSPQSRGMFSSWFGGSPTTSPQQSAQPRPPPPPTHPGGPQSARNLPQQQQQQGQSMRGGQMGRTYDGKSFYQQQQPTSPPPGSYRPTSPAAPLGQHRSPQSSYMQSPTQQPQQSTSSMYINQPLPPPAYLSRFSDNDLPLPGSPMWRKKPSRQRRFTNGTFPLIHERELAALQEQSQDFDDIARSDILASLNRGVEDTKGYIDTFAIAKEQEMAQSLLSDENAPSVDEYGNPVDEDGYPLYLTEEKAPSTSVAIDVHALPINEGYLMKKGGKAGLMERRNWTVRYFRLDPRYPTDLFYYKEKPTIPEITPYRGETERQFRERYLTAVGKHSKGRISLLHASYYIPEPRPHKDPRITEPFELNVVDRISTSRGLQVVREYNLYAETEEDFNKWYGTISYICDLLNATRAERKRWLERGGLALGSTFNEKKRDFALTHVAFGAGRFEAIAGQKSELIIQASNPDTGTFSDVGGLVFTAVLESRDLHYDLPVVDNGNGTYTVTYTPTRVGTYELSIMCEDYDIRDSPFHPIVKPAPVSAPHCLAEGAGLYCSVVGIVNEFTIHTRNSFGQKVIAENVPFDVFVSPPLFLCDRNGEESENSTQDLGDGSYLVCYRVDLTSDLALALEQGQHIETEIVVTLDDRIHTPSFPRAIKGAPFRPIVATSTTGVALQAAAMQAAAVLSPNGGQVAPLIAQLASMRGLLNAASLEQIQQPQQQPRQPQQEAKVNFEQVSSAPSGYLPIRRDSVSAVRSAPPTRTTTSSSSPSISTQIAQEKEQLARLRQELQEGRHLVNETVERMAKIGQKVQQDSDRIMERVQHQQRAFPPQQHQHHREDYPPLPQHQQHQDMQTPIQGRQDSSYQRRHFEDEEPSYQQYDTADLQDVSFSTPLPYRPTMTSTASGTAARPLPRYDARVLGSSSSATPQTSSKKPLTNLAATSSFDSSVVSLLNKHASALRSVYRHYSTRIDGIDGVRLNGLIECMTDYDVTPVFASRKELREIFEGFRKDVLDLPQFAECLAHIAISSLGKPMFSHLYTTNASRVSVMLIMWALGDPNALDAIIAKKRGIV